MSSYRGGGASSYRSPSVWQRLAVARTPEKSAIFFSEVQGMDNPWHPALTQERILLSSAMSVDPFPQASSLPEAPHPANYGRGEGLHLRRSRQRRVLDCPPPIAFNRFTLQTHVAGHSKSSKSIAKSFINLVQVL